MERRRWRGRDTGFRLAVGTTLALFCAYLIALLVTQATYIGGAPLGEMLQSRDLWFSVRLSLVTATCSTALALIVGVPAAYALSRYRFPGRALVDALVDLPIILSPVAVGTAILMLLRTPPGRFFESHFVELVFTMPGIILAQTTIVCSLAVRLLRSTFDELDPRHEQVARFLGCSPWATLWKVTLPMARGGIVAAAILCWARALGEFGATVTVAGAMRGRTETLPAAIHLGLEAVDLSRTALLMTVLLILATVVLLALRLVGRVGSRS